MNMLDQETTDEDSNISYSDLHSSKQCYKICDHMVRINKHWVTIYTDDYLPESEALSLKREICKYLFLEGFVKGSFVAVFFHKL